MRVQGIDLVCGVKERIREEKDTSYLLNVSTNSPCKLIILKAI